LAIARGAIAEFCALAQSKTPFVSTTVLRERASAQAKVGTAEALLRAARLLLYDTTRALAQGETSAVDRLRATAMAKLVASEVAEAAASQAVETLGGLGFTTVAPAEKLYRDAKIGKIYEGTSNIQLRTISSTLLREGS